MKRLQAYLPVVGIFCFALLVRIIYNLTVARDYYPLRDSFFYQSIAFSIVRAHCFCVAPPLPTVDRAPLWPAIIAVIYAALGFHDFYARLFLCFIGSGTCTLLYLFARDLFSQRIGVLAGLVAAIYPELYIYDGWLYAESLYIFLLFAFCYILYRLQRTSQAGWAILGGVVLGLLSLTRPNALLVLILFIVWAISVGWTKIIPWRVVTKRAMTIVLISLALIAPWTARNYAISQAFVPVATGDGTVLLGAYNNLILRTPNFVGAWIAPKQSNPAIARPYNGICAASCEVARENAFRSAAVQWIGSHASVMPYLLGLHFIRMWQPDTEEADLPTKRFPNQSPSQFVKSMMQKFPVPIFILAALGLVVTWRRWRELLFIYLMIALVIGENVVFYGSPRFRAPLEPILILLAAGAIWWMTQRLILLGAIPIACQNHLR